MRRGGVVVSMVGTLLLAGALRATAAQVHPLNDRELRSEINKNRKLATYVARNGCPDIAETRFLSDEPPWDEYQVTLYYFGLRKEISFARAIILGDTSIHVEKSERPLSDQDIAALQSRPRTPCMARVAKND
ncbi:MAG TPA: hypothetical protein VGR62_09170 [Candidatus Binatia bacterium]|jgi:hypothetical protein|nr:hypothetical protein [Candidatus Binatia bacterium]